MARPGLAKLYGALAVIGAVLPLSALLPFDSIRGIDPNRFFGLLFANSISSFFAWDVIVSAVAVIALITFEGRNVSHRWLAVAATLLIGVSCGLPLFLALRTRAGPPR